MPTQSHRDTEGFGFRSLCLGASVWFVEPVCHELGRSESDGAGFAMRSITRSALTNRQSITDHKSNISNLLCRADLVGDCVRRGVPHGGVAWTEVVDETREALERE